MAKLLLNCTVLTMSEAEETEALAIDGSVIAKVGTELEVRHAFPAADVLDLGGAAVIPGFIDSHVHFLQVGMMGVRPDLTGMKSADEVLERVLEEVRMKGPGEAIIAEGWDETLWSGRKEITLEELDSIAPENPVVLRRVCGHVARANTLAVDILEGKLEGVDRETGILLEEASLRLGDVMTTTVEEKLHALERAVKKAHSLGVTGIHDIAGPGAWELYSRMENGGRLPLRVHLVLTADQMQWVIGQGLKTGSGDEYLRFGGIKIFSDGSLGARTAALSADYADAPGERGMLLCTKDEMASNIKTADDNGLQVVIHAIGDAAIEEVLDAYETSIRDGNPLMHRIEHLETATHDQVERMSRLGIWASMQPNFAGNWSQLGGMNETRLGRERWVRADVHLSVLRSGTRLAFGSDGMPFGPLYGLHWAVNHPIDGERLEPLTALRAYTLAGAELMGRGDELGSIEQGKKADLVVLSEDPRTAKDISQLKIIRTFVNGIQVYGCEDV